MSELPGRLLLSANKDCDHQRYFDFAKLRRDKDGFARDDLWPSVMNHCHATVRKGKLRQISITDSHRKIYGNHIDPPGFLSWCCRCIKTLYRVAWRKVKPIVAPVICASFAETTNGYPYRTRIQAPPFPFADGLQPGTCTFGEGMTGLAMPDAPWNVNNSTVLGDHRYRGFRLIKPDNSVYPGNCVAHLCLSVLEGLEN